MTYSPRAFALCFIAWTLAAVGVWNLQGLTALQLLWFEALGLILCAIAGAATL